MQYFKFVNGEAQPFYWLHLEGKATAAEVRALRILDKKDAARQAETVQRIAADANNPRNAAILHVHPQDAVKCI